MDTHSCPRAWGDAVSESMVGDLEECSAHTQPRPQSVTSLYLHEGVRTEAGGTSDHAIGRQLPCMPGDLGSGSQASEAAEVRAEEFWC